MNLTVHDFNEIPVDKSVDELFGLAVAKSVSQQLFDRAIVQSPTDNVLTSGVAMMRALALYAYSMDPSEIRKMDNDFSDPTPIKASTHQDIEARLDQWLQMLQDLRALGKIGKDAESAHAVFTSCERLLSQLPTLHTQLLFFY